MPEADVSGSFYVVMNGKKVNAYRRNYDGI